MTKTCACQDLWFEVTIAYCVPLAAVMTVTYAVGLKDGGVPFLCTCACTSPDPETKAEAFVSKRL